MNGPVSSGQRGAGRFDKFSTGPSTGLGQASSATAHAEAVVGEDEMVFFKVEG